MMDNPLVLYEVKEQIAYITLNRPEKRNALNNDLSIELGKTWKRFEQDSDARVAILSGAGDAFCGGADVTRGEGELTLEALYQAFAPNGTTLLKPVVGAVHGFAVGAGYGLAIRSCDLTIAAEDTRFGFPEPRVGTVGGIIEYLPYMPFKISLEFHLTGWMMSAHRAYEVGLVNKVVPKAELMDEAARWAERLKKNAPLVMRVIKYSHYKAMDTIANRSRLEFEAFIQPVRQSQDRLEGSRAFFEKREPRFEGK